MKDVTAQKAGTIEQARRAINIGLALWGVAALILIAGILWFGMSAMFEPNSPDFIPIADFFAAALAFFGTLHIGQGLLQRARNSKYGASSLEADPALLGKNYRGKIRTERPIEVSGPYTIRLLCESQAVSNCDDDAASSKSRALVWQAEVSAPASTLSSLGIPFQFRIPADGLPNRTQSVAGQAIYWTLSVSAPMAGLHYRASFPIDVGVTGPETDDDEEAETVSKQKRSVASAFAGYSRPETSGMRLLRFIAPAAGCLLFAAGAYATMNQWSFGRDGVSLAGKITSIKAPSLDVALDGGGAARVARVTKNNTWMVGQPVTVTCPRDEGATRACRMDTNNDRWIDGVGTLAVGTLLLLVGAWLWMRRRRA